MKTSIILAAGQGTRMKSERPKVLHPICGRPMLGWVVQAALDTGARDAVVVVGCGREQVEAYLRDAFGDRVRTALQQHQNGTGHAVSCALPALADDAEEVLIVYGDTPLVLATDLAALSETLVGHQLGMLTTSVSDPTGYGRIIRQSGAVVAVREHRDCDNAQRLINEINPGMYAARASFLKQALATLEPDNDQGQLYLTDVVAMAAQQGGVGDCVAAAETLVGVNDRAQLATAEDVMYQRIADGWRRRGATIRSSALIDAQVQIGREARIEHGVVLRGTTTVGDRAVIDVGCVLDDVRIDDEAYLKPYSVCSQSHVGPRAQVGPFSHLRPDSRLDEAAKVGNFVETKKTRLRKGAKANHLAYLGDGDIGEAANVGAGTIFCNYDGFNKHKTVLGDGAFIGSDSQIVAPVTIGEGAYVATGTTVTKDVPADALAIARTKQENKEGYASRLKARLARHKSTAAKGDG